ncbi:hypothetical protein BC830DRAFT_882516 [Chytriomyces sp. MP71]|nr:hypothetical protein BC830DRAFT_882516 [Chytriomyces sp. MP71]
MERQEKILKQRNKVMSTVAYLALSYPASTQDCILPDPRCTHKLKESSVDRKWRQILAPVHCHCESHRSDTATASHSHQQVPSLAPMTQTAQQSTLAVVETATRSPLQLAPGTMTRLPLGRIRVHGRNTRRRRVLRITHAPYIVDEGELALLERLAWELSKRDKDQEKLKLWHEAMMRRDRNERLWF